MSVASVLCIHTYPRAKDDLVIDTGSANTWVGLGKMYKDSRTTRMTGNTMVCIPYRYEERHSSGSILDCEVCCRHLYRYVGRNDCRCAIGLD